MELSNEKKAVDEQPRTHARTKTLGAAVQKIYTKHPQ
jgi:hypothetical protein